MRKLKCPSLEECLRKYNTQNCHSTHECYKLIDPTLFVITGVGYDYINIYSKISTDYWFIQFRTPGRLTSITLQHRHGDYGTYHFQQHCKDFAHTMYAIHSHDCFQVKRNNKNKEFKHNIPNLKYGII